MRRIASLFATLAASLLATSLLIGTVRADAGGGASVKWQPWSDDVFARATREHRLVLLGLEAVWCHWCHVMDARTFADPKVAALIDQYFIPVRVDEDSRPDIANRYIRWGWPATILFGADGTELLKLRGYYPPEVFAVFLEALAKNPVPAEPTELYPEAARTYLSQFPEPLRQSLEKAFHDAYDSAHAGWGRGNKFIDGNALTYALDRAMQGDKLNEARTRATLEQSFNLIDPVWGGAYQYSDEADWKSPHFEKIMSIQATYLRTYSLAYSLWRDAKYQTAAHDIYRYLRDFLRSPDGGFYTSQDADLSKDVDGHRYFGLADSERRSLGLPRVDTHRYARENGWAIGALDAYYDATGMAEALALATRAAEWVLANRARKGGGFRHGAEDQGGPFLGDSLAMAQGFLDLYRSSAERRWLQEARQTADFIAATFVDPATGGFVTAAPGEATALGKPIKDVRENVDAVRLFNVLSQYTGEASYRRIAEAGMGYLASPPVVQASRYLPGVLEADVELTHEPVRVTIVGHKDDPRAAALFRIALGYPSAYKRIEWWDKREGPLASADVDYPEFPEAAAFACTHTNCSLPVTDPKEVFAAIDSLDRRIR